uniref:Kelch repeat-containing protein n=1 Tax=Hyalangium gracile TaxID=394092 RepID=UPI001CC90B9D|nr:kelch repeat-containing protein [Hyalangium gracile]
MKKTLAQVLLAITVVLLVGCADSSSETGSARFAVSMRQALTSSIARVSVTSSAADIPSVTLDLAPSNGVWGGTIGNIPAGSNRSFQARAFDSSGTLLFEGSASGVTLSANQTTLVAITLQQVNPPPPFVNEAPLIDSLVASATSVSAGGVLSLWATAHDPNPGDTLSYAWSATAGSFASPSEAATSWTAPASTGLQTLTLTVTDSRGLSSSISLSVNVTHDGEGEAQLSICFNSSPVVASLGATPTQLSVGQTTSVSVAASDPDGDSLSYSWSATCAGSWSNASSHSARFTPSLLPAGACNNCRLTVSVSDGRGGQTTGSVALCVRDTPPPPPSEPAIIRSYRSSDTATPGQVLTYEVVASDPQGAALSFSWEANTGSLGTPDSDGSRSRITWTAPACVNANAAASITVTVTNPFSSYLTATRSFAVTGLPDCPFPMGYWAPTGSMSHRRTSHAMALLPGGKVLVSGGRFDEADPFEPYLHSAEVYDPAAGTWSPTGSMAEGRARHTATLLPGGKVLVVGGNNLPAAELYDPTTGTWSPTGPMATARYYHTAALLPGGSVLVAGGWGNSPPGTAVELYDPATNTWSQTGSMSSPRENHTATLLPGGRVLVAGGNGLRTVELYDPATGTWSPTNSMNKIHFNHTATLLPNGKVLVAGGLGGPDGSQETAELYDPALGTWSMTGSMATAREDHTAVLLPDGRVLAVGGQIVDGNYELASAELYTP